MRPMLASSKMCSVPGSPNAAPVMTTGACRGDILAVVDLVAAIENIGEQTPELVVTIAVRTALLVSENCRAGRSCRHCSVAVV